MANKAFRPRLARLDSEKSDPDELDRHHFGIDLASVYYYSEPDFPNRPCCAILVDITFVLRNSEKLERALVPLSVTVKGSDPKSIDIHKYFPYGDQWVEVDHTSKFEDVNFNPDLQVGVGGTGLKVAGMGKRIFGRAERSFRICLKSQRKTIAECPTRVDWTFEDPVGVHYPSSVQILIVATRTDETDNPFPFQLQLGPQLKVNKHSFKKYITIPMSMFLKPKHQGWYFSIEEDWEPTRAQMALEDVQNNKFSIIGLHAATSEWRKADSRSVSAPPSLPTAEAT